MFACTNKVDPGWGGVKVHTIGDNKGELEPLGVGWHFQGVGVEIHEYPVREMNTPFVQSSAEGSKEDESITFQSQEGLTINGDFGVRLRVDPDRVHVLYQQFRRPIDEIMDTYVRSSLRSIINEEAEDLPVEELYGGGKSEFIRAVQDRLTRQADKVGLEIYDVFVIGKFRLPPSIEDAIEDKIDMTQQALTKEAEIRKARAKAIADSVSAAGDARAERIRAAGTAEANEMLDRSLTTQIIEFERIKKWDGKLPRFAGSGTNFLLQP